MSNVQMTPVTSTSVAEIGYDADSQELHIVFISGGHYVYHQVGQEAYDEFRAADSKGRHFHAHIKDVFSFTQVG